MLIKIKEALVRKFGFFKLQINKNNEPLVISRIAYKAIIKKVIQKKLIIQSISKVLRPDKFNFYILQIL